MHVLPIALPPLRERPGDARALAHHFLAKKSAELERTILGFSDEEAQNQFGFLMNAFEYGAPPHGGIALGFDRLTALIAGFDSIRDFIAFPKNNAGRDMMIDSPSPIAGQQLDELSLCVVKPTTTSK